VNSESVLSSNNDGLLLTLRPLLKSPYFILASLLGIASLTLDIYIVYEHWDSLIQSKRLLFPVLIFFQIMNIEIRVVQHYMRLRQMCENEKFHEYSSMQKIIALAYGGLTDTLLWSFLLIFLLLFFVTILLV
jgi:hypothetical protein